MKRFLFFLFLILLTVAFATAQIRTGNIYGKVISTDGTPLPGVSVTLTGSLISSISTVTSAEGLFRFLSLPPAKDYVIKAELEGFKTVIQEGVIVAVGVNTEFTITMEVSAVKEEITVVATVPVVDTKKTSVGQNVTQEMLQSLPTARDPWVILQLIPSVQVDRENIGGAESGQQSTFTSKGAGTYDNNVWSLDGIVITDPAAIGASPTYYDFDTFEEIQVVTGGADVTVQTGGVAINMVTRRGGNRVNLGGRYYMTDSKFQADNLTEDLKKEGVVGINKVNNIKDYGINIGGPIIKDKAWWWISAGNQDIKTTTILGTRDDTLLTNYAAKLNFQLIPQNRFEAFVHIGNKEKWGRSSSTAIPLGLYQGSKYHFGSPIIKLQDEHMFGDNLFVSVKYGFTDAGFNLTPMDNLKMDKFARYDYTNKRYTPYGWQYWVSRPHHEFNVQANYYNDNLFGASHEIKVGLEYSDRTEDMKTHWAGNGRIFYNYNVPTADINGDEKPDLVPGIQMLQIWRQSYFNFNLDAYAGYISDTITYRKFTFILGLRYDQQSSRALPFLVDAVQKDNPAWKSVVSQEASNSIDRVIPGVSLPEGKPKYPWKVLSPRLGFTYDVTGDGKTIAKLTLARYGDYMGVWEGYYYAPGGVGGWMNFYWLDKNGDGIVNLNELYWTYRRGAGPNYSLYRVFDDSGNFIGNISDGYGIWWGGYDFNKPSEYQPSYYTVDKDAGSSYTWEVMATLEKEIFKDFGVGIDLTYRRMDNFRWELPYYPDTGKVWSKNDYQVAGYVPSSVGKFSTKDAAGKPWYVLKPGVEYTDYVRVMKRPDFYRDYYGIDLRFNKRLSNRWMLGGSLTLQNQAEHWGDLGYLDPTNKWAFDGAVYAPYVGGASGKIDQWVFSRWLVKLAGMYQFPYDLNASFVFLAREGYIIGEWFDIIDYNQPNPISQSNSIWVTKFGSEHLPVLWRVDLRLEKMLKIGDIGRAYLMVDIFNPFNSSIINRRYQRYHGQYFVNTGQFVPDPNDFKANEVLNPRLVRFGVRFTF